MTFKRGALYSTDKLMFVCDTPEQHDALSERGWTALPGAYKPDEAAWVEHFGSVPADEPKEAKHERVVGADTNGDGVIDQPFKKKPGAKKK